MIAVSISAQNLVQNGGFEGLDPLPASDVVTYSNDGIWRHRKVNNERIGTAYVTDEFHAGSRSLKLHLDELPSTVADFRWYYNYVYQMVGVDSSKKYTVTFWAKGNYQAQAVLYTKNASNGVTSIAGAPKTSNLTTDWAQYSLTLDIPANLPADITPQMVADNTILCLAMPQINKGSPARTIWVDDVEFSEQVLSSVASEVVNPLSIYVDGKNVFFNNTKSLSVSVYNLTGSLILSKKIEPTESISLSNPGCYILKANDYSKKIIIQ